MPHVSFYISQMVVMRFFDYEILESTRKQAPDLSAPPLDYGIWFVDIPKTADLGNDMVLKK